MASSVVGWTEISPSALRKMRAELEDRAQGVLDEMGVGALHAGYADLFFPGTSVLQTRARYLLFVPWIFLGLAQKRGTNAANIQAYKEKADAWLIERLRQDGRQHGIIGGRVYPQPPAQPADFAYWTALRTFGLLEEGTASRAQLLARWDRRRVLRAEARAAREEDIEELPLARFAVPPPPAWWMDDDHEEVTFDLEKDEAAFLQQQIATSQPGSLLGMAAALLKERRRPAGKQLCDDDFLLGAARVLDEQHGDSGTTVSVVRAVERTRAASAIAALVRATYAALVEELRQGDLERAGRPLPEGIDHYRETLRGFWRSGADTTVSDARKLDLDGIAQDIQLGPSLRDLLGHVHARVCAIRGPRQAAADLLDADTRSLFTDIERRRKGQRARLPERDGLPRREGFTSDTVKISGLDFRYPKVQQLLLDLHEGLFR